MGTILESTKELAKRFGVENEEQTIKDQIDAITESIDQNFNGSVDIASAVSEFAKNDNPDARLGTKTITENDTYIALDDELDGYSSVTVNVPEFSKVHTITTKTVYGGTEVTDNLFILRSSTGHYNITDVTGDGGIWILLDPVIEITGYSTVGSSPTFIFTPHEDLESFTSLTFTGDEIVPGDGKTYKAVIDYGSRNYVMTKFDTDFAGVIG